MTGGQSGRIPVAIVTGFLGSGKTTLLNHLLRQPGTQATAVIINEFGKVGIDHLLVETSTERMIELNNGCICCTIRGDLADKLGSLAMWCDVGRIPPVERVIVETTGLADPAPIMHTLMVDPHLLKRYRLDGVVTVVDAISGASSLDRFPEARKQVAIADRLMLSKKDLVEAHSDWETYASLEARIRRINPRVVVHETPRGVIGEGLPSESGTQGTEAAFSDLSGWIEAAREGAGEDPCPAAPHEHAHGQGSGGITSFVVELHRPVERREFNDFVQALMLEFGEHILRMKGILRVADDPGRPAVIHGVQHVLFPITWLAGWPDPDRSSKLVFIVQDLGPERIRSRFHARFG